MKIYPLYDRVIVKRFKEETKTFSGIVIPNIIDKKSDQGKVIYVGKGKLLNNGKVIPLIVKTGDHILFGKYSGQSIKLNNEEYLILREKEIFAIINK